MCHYKTLGGHEQKSAKEGGRGHNLKLILGTLELMINSKKSLKCLYSICLRNFVGGATAILVCLKEGL